MPYFVMEFVDRDFEIVETKEEAERIADQYQESIEEYADYNGEWPKGSRIIIAKLTEDRSLLYVDEGDYYKLIKEETP